ncbi:MAG: flagellar hook protein FlgE [Woeseiaceae bacterium]|nr:flagellar hook protein FlgE [Woeseiaceae bacterium]
MVFAVALSGLNAASEDLGVTANNVANVETTGFKKSRAEFAEVFATGTQSVQQSGSGVKTAKISQQFTQGNIDFTDNALDLAIAGEGFFVLSDNGARSYSRAGAFGVDNNGFVVNAQGARLQAYPSAGNGLFNTGTPEDLQLITGASPPSATGRAELGLNLPADAPVPVNPVFDVNDPSSFSHTTSFTAYDSLGAPHTATVYFIKDAAPNTWNTEVRIDGLPATGNGPVTFNPDGSLNTPLGGLMPLDPFPVTTGADPLAVGLDFANTTQFGNAFGVNSLSQDGFTTGRLTGVSVAEDGVVFARFTNGQSQELGKLALANFVNPQGLQQIGDTTWGEAFQSGDALLGEAATASFGNIQSGALEASNVDLTAELVSMITAQRNFQANAQMISTSDTVTQTIINIR